MSKRAITKQSNTFPVVAGRLLRSRRLLRRWYDSHCQLKP